MFEFPLFGESSELMTYELRSIVRYENIWDSMPAELFLSELYDGRRGHVSHFLDFHKV